eukprot:3565784-Ditylum_brightwellii.AAC.1
MQPTTPSFWGAQYNRKLTVAAIRALLQMIVAIAKPLMEDVMSQAKILGYEHEKPPTNQGKPKSSQANP